MNQLNQSLRDQLGNEINPDSQITLIYNSSKSLLMSSLFIIKKSHFQPFSTQITTLYTVPAFAEQSEIWYDFLDKDQSSSFVLRVHQEACRILAPRPGVKPVPPALQVQSLNHRTHEGGLKVVFSYLIFCESVALQFCNARVLIVQEGKHRAGRRVGNMCLRFFSIFSITILSILCLNEEKTDTGHLHGAG